MSQGRPQPEARATRSAEGQCGAQAGGLECWRAPAAAAQAAPQRTPPCSSAQPPRGLSPPGTFPTPHRTPPEAPWPPGLPPACCVRGPVWARPVMGTSLSVLSPRWETDGFRPSQQLSMIYLQGHWTSQSQPSCCTGRAGLPGAGGLEQGCLAARLGRDRPPTVILTSKKLPWLPRAGPRG